MPTQQLSLLTAAEAATYLRVSLVTIRRMTADGRLPVVRIGKSVRIRISDLESMIGTGLPTQPDAGIPPSSEA